MVIATFPAGSSVLRLFSSTLYNEDRPGDDPGRRVLLRDGGGRRPRGDVTVKVQIIMSTIEVLLLVLFAALALFHAHHVTPFSWHWFSPSIFCRSPRRELHRWRVDRRFYYWGWDVTANLNEETKDAKNTSGLGGLLGTFVVFLLFEVFTVASNMTLKPGTLANSSNVADFMYNLGQAVWHGLGGKLLIVALLLSTIATLETTLIQVTRTLFTMAVTARCPRSSGRRTHSQDAVRGDHGCHGPVARTLHRESEHRLGRQHLDRWYNAIAIQICIYYSLAGYSV